MLSIFLWLLLVSILPFSSNADGRGSVATAMKCPSLPDPSGGFQACQFRNNTFHCTFFCPFESTLMGSKERQCQSNGTWTGNETTCDRKSCSKLTVPTNGIMSCTDGNSAGSRCNFSCNDGYQLLGGDVRTCDIFDLKWYGQDASCHAMKCPKLPDPSGGFKACQFRDNNTFYCTFFCFPSFTLSGSKERQCQSNGTWTGNDATCDRKSCSFLAVPTNGIMSCTDGNSAGSRCNFSCNDGYQLLGGEVRTCGIIDLKWSGQYPSCHAISACGLSNFIASLNLPGSFHSPKYPQNYPPNSVCWWTITAPVDYRVQINVTTFDLESCCDFLQIYDAPSQEKATQLQGNIDALDVSSAPILSDSNNVTIRFTSDHSVQLKGFKLMYKATAVNMTCMILPIPSRGGKICHLSNNNTFYCRFQCNSDFTLMGSEERRCQVNGTWTGNETTCDRKSCSTLTVPTNGIMSCTDGNYIGSRCNFSCNDGYQLFGGTVRTCGIIDLKWSGQYPSCHACGLSNFIASLNLPGSFHSPKYPQNYPPNSVCWWTITAPVDNRVQINFTTFDLESCCDFLQIYDAPSQEKATQLQRNINALDVSSASVLSHSNYVTIRFTSDQSVQRKGFKLVYKATAVNMTCMILPIPNRGGKICYLSNNNSFFCRFQCNSDFTLMGSEERRCQVNGTWTGNETTCDRKSCSTLTVPTNGIMSCTDGNYIGSRCNFSCNDGYQLFDGTVRTCGKDNLKWSGQNTSCHECSFRNFNASLNLSRSLQSPNHPQHYKPNSDCWWTLTAPVGYRVQINLITFYLQICCDFLQIYDAPSQEKATQPQGNINALDVSSPPILSDSNYVSIRFTSDQYGQWGGFELTYKATAVNMTCMILPIPSRGGKICHLSNNNTFYCRFQCNSNFNLIGSEERQCQSNRTWSGNEVKCHKKSCSGPQVLSNGEVSCTDGSYVRSICNYSCKDGYQLLGQHVRSCDKDNLKWSKRPPSCHAINCPILPTPSGGSKYCKVRNNNTFYCTFYCSSDFKLFGNGERQCQSNGTWSGNEATCDKKCITLPVLTNGEMRCTDGSYIRSRCTIKCNDGYQLLGSETRSCRYRYNSYRWSGMDTSCQVCPPLPELIGGIKNCYPGINNTFYCSFDCYRHFELSGSAKRRCQSNGSWTGHQATCNEITSCSELPVPDNGMKGCTNGNNIYSICGITCNDGYHLFGSNNMICQFSDYEGHKWMGADTSCQVCPPLPVLINGREVCNADSNNTFYCKFSCRWSYELSGSAKRRCQSNGSWTGHQATCNKITSCSELPVPDNGVKRCMNGSYLGSTCTITCKMGYKQFGSEIRTCSTSNFVWSGRDTSCQGSPPTPTCTVEHSKLCDGYSYCPDNSDEKGCTCPHYKFNCDCYKTGCANGWGCIPQSYRCDGKNDCGDWSDERNCQCSDTRFQCKDNNCIDRSKVNNGKTDCVDGDDEFACNQTLGHVMCDCMHDAGHCASSSRCIPNNWIGDTIHDCGNHGDEPCNALKAWCSDCWVIINQCSTDQSKNILLRNSNDNTTKCHSVAIPSNQTQRLEKKWTCVTSPCGKCFYVFQCDNEQFIGNQYYCDTNPQCTDGSDEILHGFGFRCSGKSKKSVCVLPQKNVYDYVAQCSDGSDLCFVNGDFRCFSCLDGKLVVSAKQVCDGKVDCYDMSDECLCANQSVCNAVLGEETSRCPSNQLHCSNNTDCVDMDKVLCNSWVLCAGGRNHRFCHPYQQSSREMRCSVKSSRFGSITVTATRCDGRPECGHLEDECDNCKPVPSFCYNECVRGYIYTHWSVEKPVINPRIDGNLVCDGYVNFIGFEPIVHQQTFCQNKVEENCPMRFYCKSKDMISIDKRSVCDGILDCDDHSDEDITNCGNKRFYCPKGNAISIDKAFVCDGLDDCDNGEDENRQLCGGTVSWFSDEYEMIANPVLRALFWIMGLLALSGNLLINFFTAKDVLIGKNSNPVKLSNDILILNLTISDFLMGVYLIAVVAQGQKYSGYYGSVDKEWRSSNLCSGLGTLAVLSSETSALVMTVMSTFRLITVYKPFSSSSIKIKWIVITGFSCWIFSFFLAAIPWFPFDSGYFVTDVWIVNVLFKNNTVSKSDIFGLAKRISINNHISTSWFKVKETIKVTFPYNAIKGEFGYYGETSVCMPRFYASTNEAAWQYSVSLITLNFVLFLYMVTAYLLVYKKAGGMKNSRSTKKDLNKGMQKRISRLLLTDFCCWIPVCVMGYLSVSGVSLSPNAYIVSAGFLLPINSALNPILYSKYIGQKASQAEKWIILKFSRFCSSFAGKVDAAYSSNTSGEAVEMRVIEANC